MIEVIAHVTLPIVAFLLALYVERRRAYITRTLLFWKHDHDLEGNYTARWTIERKLRTLDPSTPPEFEEYVEIEWSAGGYIMATGTNARLGKYNLVGKRKGNAIAFSYASVDRRFEENIGLILLQVMPDQSLAGQWIQNRSDISTPLAGSTVWTKR